MCGILFFSENPLFELSEVLKPGIRRRGPSHAEWLSLPCSHPILYSSVLHIQGVTICKQPFVDEDANVLSYNGEIFAGYNCPNMESDTPFFATLIGSALNGLQINLENPNDMAAAIASKLSHIEGPFAFVFYHNHSKTLFFGRDPFGRLS